MWVDHVVMKARTQVTAFHTGPSVGGSWVVVAVEEGREPIVYTVLGKWIEIVVVR